MEKIKVYLPHAMAIFMSLIFLDSLRFKFTNHPNTQEIFGLLNEWAASFGADGLFAQTGLFSQYVIGVAELCAAIFLLIGIIPKLRHLQAIGAAIGVAVMTGAISFHVFTPLGIDPNNDGAGLFMAACANLVFGLVLLFVFRRRDASSVLQRLVAVIAPPNE